MSRLRVRFDKHGKVRFTSHRDVARIWERTLRRASLPVAYSEGFSPRPRLSFGLALATGYSSDAEYLDVHLAPGVWDGSCTDAEALAALLSEHLPVGMRVVAVREIDSGVESLQQAVTSCTWQIDVVGAEADALQEAAQAALKAEELIVTRTRKSRQVTDDIRPLVIDLEVAGSVANGSDHARNDTCVRIVAELGTQPRAVRVPELLAALDPSLAEHRVHRTHQWILTSDGKRTDPMSVDAPPPAASEAK